MLLDFLSTMVKGWGLGQWLTAALLGLIALLTAMLALTQEAAKKAIDSRFDREADRLKADQQAALERLKFDINTSLSRISKLQQFEFEVLPEAWRLLHVALGDLQTVASRRLIRMPHLNELRDDAMKEYVNSLNISARHKRDIIESDDHHGTYFAIIDHYNLAEARSAHTNIHNYLLEKGIFIEPELNKALKELVNDINRVLIESETKNDFKSVTHTMTAQQILDLSAKADAFNTRLPERIRELEERVAGRLWDISIR